MAVAMTGGAQQPGDCRARRVAEAAPVAFPHLPPDRRRNSAAADARLRRRSRRREEPAASMRRRLRAASYLRRSGDSGGCRGPVRCLPPASEVAEPAGSSVRGAATASFGTEVSAVTTSAVRVANAGRFATERGGGRRPPAHSAPKLGRQRRESAGYGPPMRRPRRSWRSSASCTTRPRVQQMLVGNGGNDGRDRRVARVLFTDQV